MKYAWQRYVASIAALICAVSVALSAYASHGLEADVQRRLMLACYFAFAHGLSLIVLVQVSSARSNVIACIMMLSGLLLFSGSLASAALWQTSTKLVPYGGTALILAWLFVAVNFTRFKED